MPLDDYPSKEQFVEEITYEDKNGFEWRIARVENGFIVAYFGASYFSPKTFECQIHQRKRKRIKNTNCVFVQNTDFDTFCHFRNILQAGYTDTIWETFEEFFTERLRQNDDILECEVV
jgi:hypothetical protein